MPGLIINPSDDFGALLYHSIRNNKFLPLSSNIYIYVIATLIRHRPAPCTLQPLQGQRLLAPVLLAFLGMELLLVKVCV